LIDRHNGYLSIAVSVRLLGRIIIERMDPVRRVIFAGAMVAAIAPAAVASATTPPEPTEPAAATETTVAEVTGDTTASEGATAPDQSGEVATVFDDSGNAVATITAGAAEVGFADYEEGNDPEAGSEYVRMVVTVESLITEGTINVNVDDFILQSNNGFVTTAENVPTAAEAEADEDITEEADLANGEAVELTLTFEVVSSVGPQSVFYRPEDDRLVDVAEVGTTS
jgi:hypothetical protein